MRKEHPAAKGKMWSHQLEVQALWHILQGEHFLLSQLEHADFYDSHLRAVFMGMQIDYKNTKDVQLGTLDIVLSQNNRYPGFEWLLNVLNADFMFIAEYRTTVSELKKLRAKREAASFQSTAKIAEEIPLEFQKKAKEIQESIKFEANPMQKHIERIKEGVNFVPTGFPTLDEMFGGGIECGGIMTLAANTGMGKSAFATTVAKNAISIGLKVCFCTLEMAEERIVIRVLQSFWGETEQRVCEHIDDMAKIPGELLTVAPGHSIEKVLAALTSCLEADLFIVDYFQLIQSNQTDNHYANLELVSNKLKEFAFEHKKPMLLLSQLNRELDKDRRNREPVLSDLRGTGALAQDAHQVVFLWDKNAKEIESVDGSIHAKKEKLGMESGGHQSTVDGKDLRLIVRKNRNGRIGKVYVDFDPTTMSFTESEDTTFRT